MKNWSNYTTDQQTAHGRGTKTIIQCTPCRPIFSRALAEFQTIVFIILCKLQEPKSLRGDERGLVERRRGPLLFSSFVFFFSLFLFFSPACRPPAFSRDRPPLNESLKQASKATRLKQSKLEGRNASRKPITINLFFFHFTGFILAISCGIYPSGWGSVEFKQACGNDANFYKLGHCNLGWAFFVFVSGTGSAFICAVLSTRAGKQEKMLYSRTSIERSNSFLM